MNGNSIKQPNSPRLSESVLIVDDEVVMAESIAEYLAIEGYRCIHANDYDSALRVFREEPVFLVITDYNVPGRNGLELAATIKEASPLLPIFLMTGHGEKELVVDALRVGVNDFIDKPFRYDELKSKIEAIATQRLADIEREKTELEDLRRTFVEEARAILVDLDPLLTDLDEGNHKPEDLNLIYRKVHTLKGSAGSLPKSAPLVRLAHSFETVLSAIKDGRLGVSSDLLTIMLGSFESLVACVQAIDSGADLPDTTNLQNALDAYSKGETPSGAPKANATLNQTAATKPPSTLDRRKTDNTEDGVMVHNDKLELLKDLAGELVAFKNTYDVFLKQHGDQLGVHLRELMEMARTLFKITDELQDEVSNIQQVTFGKTFSKFPRIVKQVSGELGKQIKLNVVGAEMTVDRTVSRTLGDALLHAVRNSCDHGVERPETRSKAGKAIVGNITIKGHQSADTITVEVADDGAGLNRERILKKAIEKDLLTAEKSKELSDDEVWDLLFLPNFSTADKVSDISGRGVGMDVVRTAAKKLGGNAWFSTIPGRETKLTLRFPVPKSLVVESSVVAKAGEHILIVPLNSISEIRNVDESEMTFVQPYWTFQNRGMTVPVGSYLFAVEDPVVTKDLREKASYKKSGLVAVLQHRGHAVGIYLDQILDQIEAVIRPFDDVIGKISGFRGVSRLPGDNVGYVLSAEEAVSNVLELSKQSSGESNL